MISLRELILEFSKSEAISDMKKHFDYVSKKYFSSRVKYPTPSFKVKPNLKNVGAYIPSRNEFVMHMDFANDPELLKGTMYHEAIHYFQVHQDGFDSRKHKRDGYHDDYFHQMAKKINSGEGKKYVSVSGSIQKIKSGKSVKPFWVYTIDKGDGDINWMWSPRKNQKIIDTLIRMRDYYKWTGIKVFETDIISFKEAPRSNGGRNVRYGTVSPNENIYKLIYPAVKKQKHIK